jgi:DNA repair exonuclease SbcCD ATPase subunit
MRLDKLILVHWGSLQTQEFEMGSMTLLSGPTGSGKTTMLDALQTVMSGVHSHIFSYNPAQDETSQSARDKKTKRTLWSFIVGADDNLFARPDGAHGYIAAVFQPGENEPGKPFTAIVGAAAKVDASGSRRQAVGERLALLLVDNAACRLEDFYLAGAGEDGRDASVNVQHIHAHLKARYKEVTFLHDHKREYLCQLYGRFRGRTSVTFPEAEAAAKAWCQSIAHRPIGSVDELVRNQILEFDSSKLTDHISRISQLMRQVSGLRKEGERIRANIGRLATLETAIASTTGAHVEAALQRLHAARRRVGDAEQALWRNEQATRTERGRLDAQQARLEEVRTQRVLAHEALVSAEARLQGLPVYDQKRQFDTRIAQASGRIRALAKSLRAAATHAVTLTKAASQVGGAPYPASYRAVSDAAVRVSTALGAVGAVDFSVIEARLGTLADTPEGQPLDEALATELATELLVMSDDVFSALTEALKDSTESWLRAMYEQSSTLDTELANLGKSLEAARRRKATLATGGADYPDNFAVWLRQLQDELPEANAKPLCDLVDIRDASWQAAIEGYLDGNRFNLVVEERFERAAIDWVARRRARMKVIQGSLVRREAAKRSLPSDSIVHELKTDHPTAWAYLVSQYGGVLKVADSEALRHTHRGVTKDGKGAGGYAMYGVRSDMPLVFGAEARRLSYESASRDFERIEAEVLARRSEKADIERLIKRVSDAKTPTFAVASIELDEAARELALARDGLSRLDLTEVDSLQRSHAEKRARHAELDVKYTELGNAIAQHQARLKELADELPGLARALEADKLELVQRQTMLQSICLDDPELSFQALDTVSEKEFRDAFTAVGAYQNAAQRASEDVQRFFGDVRLALGGYNTHARSEERLDIRDVGLLESASGDFGPLFAPLVRLRGEVRRQLATQRDIGLAKNVDELRVAEASFRDVFVQQFCVAIRNSVEDGIRTLRMLNDELARLKFGTDRFRIDWSEWVPEYREYYHFFNAAYELADTQEQANLFDSSALSEKDCEIRDRLVGLLLADNQAAALKDLERIADYRQYRRYEIWKESDTGSKVRLSEWGTGSGGQLETPAYIVRAAVVTNRLKHFEKGPSLKLLVNDESFAKMDETRAHDVIKFIRDALGIQLVCAMPTKHTGALKSEFTKEWSFSRTDASDNGEVSYVSEADERDLRPDALRALWDARRAQVREQAKLAFEAAHPPPVTQPVASEPTTPEPKPAPPEAFRPAA